jgi:hypothetical protein
MSRSLSSALLLASLVAGCQCGAPVVDELGEPLEALPAGSVVLQFGPDLDASTRARVEELVRAVSTPRVVEVVPPEVPPAERGVALILAFGRTAVARTLLPRMEAELEALGSEGFLVRSGTMGGARAFAAVGNAREEDPRSARLGTGFGAYALLEELGFGFLHPLEPTLPSTLRIPREPLALSERPHWKVRGLQLHTMHPLELTDVLNGWGKTGPEDEAGFRAMLPEWERFLEWMLANRQNRVHWLLLHAESWADFSDGPVRLARLRELVDLAHARGLLVGVDVPIALEQQHAFRLLRHQGTVESETAEIRQRVDWLMGAGFDYLATEAGFSEFTHPTAERMLAWMNELARHLDEAHGGKQAIIKIHCSQEQTADPYTDPRTGGPLNFNFLPTHADPRLGVMPHTVQHYSLDDPAPTYSNTDFGYIREYLQYETGKRPVIWHPETAYWVSFDIDVPLFLPVYAERRVHDLRLLGHDERAGRMGGATGHEQIDGQIIFSSGWEWGYWLNDVVTARAAWNPRLDAADDEAALRLLLRPVSRSLGTRGDEVVDVLVRMMGRQRELLIEGRVNGRPPADIQMRNGQAYLQGWDTWDDVGNLGRTFGVGPQMQTQPDKLGLVNMRNPLHGGPGYSKEIEPLLREMRFTLGNLADELEALRDVLPPSAHALHAELAASAQITALRAQQVHGLYDYVDGYIGGPAEERQARLASARQALDEALTVVQERERHYRVDADRIAGWRNGPTAYEFGYLWTARTLHYWWRDEGKAVEAPVSPCYLNIINPVDVAMGEGDLHDLVTGVRHLFEEDSSLGVLTECIAETREEPRYPNARIGR